MKLMVLDLFAGLGGFSLGLERTQGFETVAFCEIEPNARRVLNKHWPQVPVYEDVRTLTAERLAEDGIRVDVLTAGFPCQDLSRAGNRAGLSGTRSGLFWELVRAVRMVRPRFAILENVADLLSGGMGDVCGALAESGLRVEWDCVPAYACGSPQQRDRVWIVAHPDREGKLQPGWCFRYFWGRPVHRGTGSQEWHHAWTDRLAALCRVDDGVSRRLGEIALLGNTVLPQIPEMIGRAILEDIAAEQSRPLESAA